MARWAVSPWSSPCGTGISPSGWTTRRCPGKLDWELFLGSAPQRPLEPKRFRWWRGFWDYSGGNMTDQGTHLMDVVQWMTNSGPPRSVVCQGQADRQPRGRSARCIHGCLRVSGISGAVDVQLLQHLRLGLVSHVPGRQGVHGPRPERLSHLQGPRRFARALDAEGQAGNDCAGAGPRQRYCCTSRIFWTASASRQEPNCPIEVAAAAVAGPHMANLAYREDRKVKA